MDGQRESGGGAAQQEGRPSAFFRVVERERDVEEASEGENRGRAEAASAVFFCCAVRLRRGLVVAGKLRCLRDLRPAPARGTRPPSPQPLAAFSCFSCFSFLEYFRAPGISRFLPTKSRYCSLVAEEDEEEEDAAEAGP